ncbi:thymidine phosphorylase [Rhizobium sp. Leaf384]|uniref:thymidine phosphorylase n=1 Tax=unclassified Rhizobium TaxID=2613769 RepID=UPI0007161B2F|nr:MULTISPECIES: thymidine phosphorylase [unclassified Rhizobium]KQS81379.1 thymidine phosphorylase [Rhizobium sp. Leaf384]KQS87289.1 thymidine phosphorylase [Rhizobium sp. Leaf383]
MIPQEIIRRKRDRVVLEPDDIAAFVAGMADGSIADAQVAAFAMATWFSGMTRAETVALTVAMRDSGTVLDYSVLGRPVADKHSTGGVGDNVSLMLAPILAACGLVVPMISGRGLGHTGGTLDKLESIPGYDIAPSVETLRRVMDSVGCAIIGQTADLAPADRRLYAIRDVTATVDSVPLITASILSKKLAAGLGSLVLDVKVGSGAFMESQGEAEILARSLVDVANGAGLRTTALITDMSEPLADAVGNALEIRNCLAFLRGEKQGTRLEQVVMALASEMLLVAGVTSGPVESQDAARRALESGGALEVFGRMVAGHGGPADFVERPDTYLTTAPISRPVVSDHAGVLQTCDARAIGMALIALGGGRTRADQAIDHSVGFSDIVPLGHRVAAGEPLAVVHAASDAAADEAAAALKAAYTVTDGAFERRPIILSRLTA